MTAPAKVYLGDSVYCEFDERGWSLILTTENGYGPSNTIVLEPQVLEALDKFREQLKQQQT
jgi:hypothetical protein